jgi:hypothetical protein
MDKRAKIGKLAKEMLSGKLENIGQKRAFSQSLNGLSIEA